ncbi:non-ribosomal peptide synthetase [Saccharopolyspora sp. MS10]|uniref:non-ribosomal peptide synthetase n=1 Tax=Saccharopolyspora sp. MS10 TaxID=3385973 RepID=UPI00399EFE1A
MSEHPRLPATRKETALWMLEEFVPGTGANNLSLALRVRGGLDRAVAQEALRLLVARFAVLRTVFHRSGAELSKAVVDELPVELATERLEPNADAGQRLTRFVALPFRPDGSPLLRAMLLSAPGGDVFCLALHHAICDVQSTEVLREAFAGYCTALARGERPAPESRAEVPPWREPDPSPDSERYWREQLSGFDPAALELRCQHAEPGAATLRGEELTRSLSPDAHAAVRRLCRQVRAPESVVLLAAYAVLLAAHGAGPDVVVGAPFNTRGKEAPDAVGYHSSLLPLRLRADPAGTFRALATAARTTFMEAVAHRDFSADELLDVVERTGSQWRNVLFRHAFNYVPHARGQREFEVAGRPAELLPVENGSSQFDLEFFVSSDAESAAVRAVFYTGVLARADVELMVHRYDELLVTLAGRLDEPIGQVPVWCERDRAIIGAANDTGAAPPEGTVLHAVARQVEAAPGALAIRDGERGVRYGGLWRAAIEVRDRLGAAGVRGGDVVALLLPRGPELAAAVFGTWLAGATYLPLDPNHPRQRIDHQLADSGARTALVAPGAEFAGDRTCVEVPAVEEDGSAPSGALAAADAADAGGFAYLIYTSGSTGLPKGIPILHRSLLNVLTDYADRFGVAGSAEPTGWMSTFSFDTSALELMMPLMSGGHAVVLPDEARTDGALLAAAIEAHGIGFLQATPTTWRLVADRLGALLAGRRLLCGGEPLPSGLARRLVAAGARLWNVYGPTESTIWATAGEVPGEPGDRVDVGSPVAATSVFIAGPRGERLPVGVRGELCVAGVGVGPGYHARPELTAERFGVDEVHGRFYRSGDVARWLPDGRIDLHGRIDRQVKLRGNRVELGEVEAVLQAHPEVAAAAVVVAGDPGGDGVLAAFLRMPHRPEAVGELWEHARAALPAAVVPHRFTALESFPRTGSDKVDYLELARRADADRAAGAAGGAEPGEEPEDGLAAHYAELWRELLGRAGLGRASNFFTSGGHSLLAAELAERIRADVGVRLKLSDVFENPTPDALAAKTRALEPAARAPARSAS